MKPLQNPLYKVTYGNVDVCEFICEFDSIDKVWLFVKMLDKPQGDFDLYVDGVLYDYCDIEEDGAIIASMWDRRRLYTTRRRYNTTMDRMRR